MIASAIKSSISSLISLGRKPEIKGDFIVTKGGRVIETSPEDTIIATKNPEGLGGGTKTFNFYGVTPQQMIDTIKRELGVDVFRSSRF